MQCLNPSVLERQITQQCQQQQQQQGFSIETLLSLHNEGFGSDGCWPATTNSQYPVDQRGFEEISAVSAGSEKTTKKRKSAEKQPPLQGGNDGSEKRAKGEGNGAEKPRSNRREASVDSLPKEELKKKPDYIHVRARRGQATDSHSLAERVRRERISERMKYLQGLVPGCNKITGKAGMLDEIINYVQSLQRQVEFLSMKLAAVNPRLDFNIENFFSKEMNVACNLISAAGLSPELIDPSFLQFNPLQQATAAPEGCGVDMAMDPAEIALRRTMSAPSSSAPETILDSCFNVNQASSGWENELQRLYGVEFNQGRGSAFPFQSLLQGNLLPNNLKMEM